MIFNEHGASVYFHFPAAELVTIQIKPFAICRNINELQMEALNKWTFLKKFGAAARKSFHHKTKKLANSLDLASFFLLYYINFPPALPLWF